MVMIFESLETYGCEEVAFFYDKEAGLKSIIAIHDTTLGPAWGGTRLWDYKSEQEALTDVLRLARGMTRKASISGIEVGGGKAVIMARPEQKTEALLRAHGRCVESFKGRFMTGEDVGIGVDLVGQHWLLEDVLGQDTHKGISLEGNLPRQHLIHDHPDGVDINPLIRFITLGLLG